MSRSSRSRAFLFVLLTLFLPLILAGRLPATATTAPSFVETGHIGETAYAVAARGQTVLVGEGPRLTIFDAAAPGPPFPLSQAGPLPDIIYDIALDGDLAYLAAGDGGLRLVDISDPEEPRVLGASSAPSAALDVAAADGYAYVLSAAHDLRVVDARDPLQPVEVAALAIDGLPRDIVLNGSYAYLATGEGGFQVVDIAVPEQPRRAGRYSLPGWTGAVAIAWPYAYVGNLNSGLHVFDVTNPAAPVPVWSQPAPRELSSMLLVDTYLYVTGGNDAGLQILDLADPAAPVLAGTLDTVEAWSLALAGTTLYAAAANRGLSLTDVADPARPAPAGAYDLLLNPHGLTVHEKLAYVNTETPALDVIDLAAAEGLKPIRSVPIMSSLGTLTIAGDTGYATVYSEELHLFDFSDPLHPIPARKMDLGYAPYLIAAPDDRLVIASFYGSLHVYDRSNPLAPVLLGQVATPDHVLSLAVHGSTACLVLGDGQLHLYDLSDPTAPAPVGVFVGDLAAETVLISGTLAYLGDRVAGVRVIDVSDPANPVEVGATGDPDHAVLLAQDGFTLLARSTGGGRPSFLHRLNVVDPKRPFEAARFELVGSGGFPGAALAGDTIVALTSPDGLRLLRYTGPRTVAGRIALTDGTPVSGVTVWASPAHATTDDDGRYFLFDVPSGDHIVRPALAGYTFDPPQTAVSLPPDRVDLEFTATAWTQSWRALLPVVGR